MHRQPGRPAIDVDMNEVEYLRSLRFTWTKIANILGISRSTLYRRLDEEGVSQHTTFTNITDAELDQKVAAIKNVHPNDG
jgi:DNA invertase Pin-like site-specific DNA recombinase